MCPSLDRPTASDDVEACCLGAEGLPWGVGGGSHGVELDARGRVSLHQGFTRPRWIRRRTVRWSARSEWLKVLGACGSRQSDFAGRLSLRQRNPNLPRPPERGEVDDHRGRLLLRVHDPRQRFTLNLAKPLQVLGAGVFNVLTSPGVEVV